jgi:hypothetical protein
LIDSISDEIAPDQVWGGDRCVTGDGGTFPLLRMPSAQSGGLHQPPHPFEAYPDAMGVQLGAHASHARVST